MFHFLQFHSIGKTNFQLALVYNWKDCTGNIVRYLDSYPKGFCIRLALSVSLRHRPIVDPKLYSKLPL